MVLLLAGVSQPVLAQSAPRAAAPTPSPKAGPTSPPKGKDAAGDNEVVVTAKKEPGAVIGDIKPELQLTPEDIQSYGVATMAELLDELAPQTRSDRGRGGEGPVVLLNGHRISGFGEIRDIPTEAILRVDILPEEVALKYGYTADQRVVNIVLKPLFQATTADTTIGAPTRGGQVRGQLEGDLFHIKDDDRVNIDVRLTGATAITDRQRHVIEAVTGPPYDLIGNVVSAVPGGQIDPTLSARAGQPVTVAGVPASAAAGRTPSLNDFLATANNPNVTDVSGDRTLAGLSKAVTVNSVYARQTAWGAKVAINGTLGATSAESRQGLPGLSLMVPAGDPFSPFANAVDVLRYDTAFGALRQTTDGWTGHLGLTVNKDLSDWRFSFTSAYDHADTLTRSDAGLDTSGLQGLLNSGSTSFNPFGPLPEGLIRALPEAKARSLSDTANAQILASGTILKVPAGNFFTSLKAGDSVSNLDSRSFRLSRTQTSSFNRNDASAQANFDLPVTSVKNQFLAFAGDLSVNGNLALNQFSDFGTLYTYGFGVNWTPITGVNLIVSQTHDEAAPSQAQLGNPTVATPGTRIFDYATGQTIEVTAINGGNPALQADARTVRKIGLTYKPFASTDFTFTANYIWSDIKNPIAGFPAATAEVEKAFPDRFVRDASGRLIQVDYRPVNFADQRRSELRWGFNFMMPLSAPSAQQGGGRRFGGPGGFPRPPGGGLLGGPPDGAEGGGGGGGAGGDGGGGGAPAAGPSSSGGGGPGGGGPGGGGFGGGGFGGGGPRGGGRGGGGGGFRPGGASARNGLFQVAVYHTVFFTDEILVRRGGPLFDLLNGSAAGSSGGQPRQEVEAQLGYTKQGYGARLSADWKEGTRVDGGAATGNLTFSDIATVNLRLFVSFDLQPQILKQWPILKGSRLTLSATNLFDQHISVHDANGAVPLSYQPAYLELSGRVISLNFRKLF